MKIVIAGGHGFIGGHLAGFLRNKGHSVSLLTRTAGGNEPFWDPIQGQLDPDHLEGADAVINLSGENVLGRWNQEKMEKIRDSRFATTSLLVDTMAKLKRPPKVYVCASAIGYYGDRGEERLTEKSSSGHGYLAEVCRLWEAIPKKLQGIRFVTMRLGLVLGKEGGALKKMLASFKLGCGGVLGDGKQIMSWISIDDLVRAFLFVLEHEVEGAVNVVAPHPVTNEEFTRTLGKVLHRPTLLPLPRFLIKLFFGSGAELLLSSAHVVPEKLLREGFTFQQPELEQALQLQIGSLATQSSQ